MPGTDEVDGESESTTGDTTESESESSTTETTSTDTTDTDTDSTGTDTGTDSTSTDTTGTDTDSTGTESDTGVEPDQTERLVLSSSSGGRVWLDPALSAELLPAADVSYSADVLFDAVVGGQRLFVATEDGHLRIYQPFVTLSDDAAVTHDLPPAALFDAETVLRPTMRVDIAGRLWVVSDLGMLRFDDAAAIDDASVADALLATPDTAFSGETHDASDRAFVAGSFGVWIWEQASTRIDLDGDFDEFLPADDPTHVIVAGDRLVVAEANQPQLALYDAATVSALNPDPVALLPGFTDPWRLYVRGNLLFVIDTAKLHVIDLDSLEVVGELAYDEDYEPDELIYSSKHNLYLRLPDGVDVWSDVPENPSHVAFLSGDGEALGMALQECFGDGDCDEGSCVSGLCRP